MRKRDVREKLQNMLEEQFVQDKDNEWVSVEKININRVDIAIVSEKDENINEIQKRIESYIEEYNINLENYEKMHIGFLNVYTVEEAEFLGIEKPKKRKTTIASFGTIIDENENNVISDREENRHCKVISFYSYKGGVGRTIALMQTANLLALKGKKIALIDLDIEAPSFNEIFSESIQSDKGLINYLYGRLYNLDKIEISSIVSKLSLNVPGDVYIVPTGSINKKYVKMLEALKEKRISENKYIEELIEELYKNYNIDYVLIDSRTGINNWGALAIGEIADEVMLFAYPNEENVKGINLILDMIQDRKKCTVVFSRIADTDEGISKAKELFNKIDIEQEFMGIEYDSSIAVSSKYPIENKLNKFNCISGFILEDEINKSNSKWINDNKETVDKILEYLSEGRNFNNIMTNDEKKFREKSNFIVVKNNKIKLEELINNDEKIVIVNFVNEKIGVYKNTRTFIADILANVLFSYKDNIENDDGIIPSKQVECYLSSLEESLKDDNSESLELIIKNFLVKLEEIKRIQGNLYFVLNIDELINYVKADMEFDYFKLILVTIRALNGLKGVQFKIIFDECQYEHYKEELLKEEKANLLNLSWNVINDDEILVDNIKQILDKTSIYVYENINGKFDLFNLSEYMINDMFALNNRYDTNLVYCKRVDSTKYSKEFANWLSGKMRKKEMLSKKDILDVIREAAKIEIEADRKNKTSIITFESFNEAIERKIKN
jgi:ATPases involved in chromosome partitioning